MESVGGLGRIEGLGMDGMEEEKGSEEVNMADCGSSHRREGSMGRAESEVEEGREDREYCCRHSCCHWKSRCSPGG